MRENLLRVSSHPVESASWLATTLTACLKTPNLACASRPVEDINQNYFPCMSVSNLSVRYIVAINLSEHWPDPLLANCGQSIGLTAINARPPAPF
eukprot:sb/3479237/